MDTITCPKCGTINPASATNCKKCRINLKFAVENLEIATDTSIGKIPEPPPAKSRKQVLFQISSELGGEFIIPVDFANSEVNTVEAHIKDWTLNLEFHSESPLGIIYHDPTYLANNYTRMSAIYRNEDGFKFGIYRRNTMSQAPIVLEMQVVDTGYPDFDREYIVRANDESKAHALMENPKIRDLISRQRFVVLGVKRQSFLAKSPHKTDELFSQEDFIIEDPDRLKSLFEVFIEILEQLRVIKSASAVDTAYAPPEVRQQSRINELEERKERVRRGLCPKCGTKTTSNDVNCPSCKINLAYARSNIEQW